MESEKRRKSNIMKNLLLPGLITFAVLALNRRAWSATYYVKSGGNNSAAGTSDETAWAHCPGMSGWTGSVTLSNGDTIKFAQGDVWSWNQAGIIWNINRSNITVDSYNNGGGTSEPIFDGGVSDDFATDPIIGSKKTWDRIISINNNNITVRNLELRNYHGSAIVIYADGIINGTTIEYCKIHNIAYSGIVKNNEAKTHTTNTTVQYNEVYKCQRRQEKWLAWGKTWSEFWGAGISISPSSGNSSGNLIQYNYVHDIYGEGINIINGSAQYNVVENTYSGAIYPAPCGHDITQTTIVKGNLVIQTQGGFREDRKIAGITFRDETPGYDIDADIHICGNIVIGAYRGIAFRAKAHAGENVAFDMNLYIYNNTVIDSIYGNYLIGYGAIEELEAGGGHLYFYNNSSIYYNRAKNNPKHITDWSTDGSHIAASSSLTLDHNHFYGGNDNTYTNFTTNSVTGDPVLAGEPDVNWDGLTGRGDVNFDTHLYPEDSSALVDTGKSLTFTGVNTKFLTSGTDFNDLPGTKTMATIHQGDHGTGWDIGAIIKKSLSTLVPPVGLTIL